MIHLDSEALLKQLGYNSVSDALKVQMNKIIANTKGFELIEQHIIPFNDNLKPHKSHIALSNSKDYLKIKIEVQSPEIIKDTKEMIVRWAKKYKVDLEKVENKETYYILGVAS